MRGNDEKLSQIKDFENQLQAAGVDHQKENKQQPEDEKKNLATKLVDKFVPKENHLKNK